jgi:hypothetical protein
VRIVVGMPQSAAAIHERHQARGGVEALATCCRRHQRIRSAASADSTGVGRFGDDAGGNHLTENLRLLGHDPLAGNADPIVRNRDGRVTVGSRAELRTISGLATARLVKTVRLLRRASDGRVGRVGAVPADIRVADPVLPSGTLIHQEIRQHRDTIGWLSAWWTHRRG